MFYGTKVRAAVRAFEVIPVDHPKIKLGLDEHITEAKSAGVAPSVAAGTFMIKVFASWSLSEKEHLRERAEQGLAMMRKVMVPEVVDTMLGGMVKKLQEE